MCNLRYPKDRILDMAGSQQPPSSDEQTVIQPVLKVTDSRKY